jgi:hypothetical protein
MGLVIVLCELYRYTWAVCIRLDRTIHKYYNTKRLNLRIAHNVDSRSVLRLLRYLANMTDELQ